MTEGDKILLASVLNIVVMVLLRWQSSAEHHRGMVVQTDTLNRIKAMNGKEP